MKQAQLEIWGGIECTVNRVGDAWFNQLESNGHSRRPADLELIAGLGIRTLRYPVLWELTAPRSCKEINWSWVGERLGRLRSLGITPIAGLLHHGSGPRYTSLVDERFPELLAEYATCVAQRFPWLEWYTPVNEPLTTARFSGLYGHWYPHGRDDRTFARALFNQCRGTALAMQAIRRVNSSAKLVQTDDLGTIHSTPRLRYQADFENERRWLTWDLLAGTVDKHHPMRPFLRANGVSDVELDWFLENPCPPDIIGINHYVTSDRFLDERWEHYPARCHGANAYDRYADVEAVRVFHDSYVGWHEAIRQAWQRYRLPIALTEVHLGCECDEQLRWLHEAWEVAVEMRTAGADVRALTAWALFGSFDWDTLVTRNTGQYEPGAFDVSSGMPRETPLGSLIRDMAHARPLQYPALQSKGWWQRAGKVLYKAQMDLGRMEEAVAR